MKQQIKQECVNIKKQLTPSQQETLPVLTYYDIRGICQPIRNLLYFIQVDFKDKRVDRSTQATKQYQGFQSVFNSGLPIFEDKNIKISDSVAIAFYICKKYEKTELLGKSLRCKSKINQILFKYYLEKSKMMPFILDIVLASSKQSQAKKVAFINGMVNKLLNSSRFLSYCLKKHHQTKKWVQQQLTIVDFYFYEICYYLKGFFQKQIAQNDYLKGFIDFSLLIESMGWYQKNKSLKPKIFLPFKNQKIQEAVVKAWNNQNDQQII